MEQSSRQPDQPSLRHMARARGKAIGFPENGDTHPFGRPGWLTGIRFSYCWKARIRLEGNSYCETAKGSAL
jgi:hypothetical protein